MLILIIALLNTYLQRVIAHCSMSRPEYRSNKLICPIEHSLLFILYPRLDCVLKQIGILR